MVVKCKILTEFQSSNTKVNLKFETSFSDLEVVKLEDLKFCSVLGT